MLVVGPSVITMFFKVGCIVVGSAVVSGIDVGLREGRFVAGILEGWLLVGFSDSVVRITGFKVGWIVGSVVGAAEVDVGLRVG